MQARHTEAPSHLHRWMSPGPRLPGLRGARSTAALSARQGPADPEGIQSRAGGQHCSPSSPLQTTSQVWSRTQHLAPFLSPPTTKPPLAVSNNPAQNRSPQPAHLHFGYFVNRSSEMNHVKQKHPSTAEVQKCRSTYILEELPSHKSWSPHVGGTSEMGLLLEYGRWTCSSSWFLAARLPTLFSVPT